MGSSAQSLPARWHSVKQADQHKSGLLTQVYFFPQTPPSLVQLFLKLGRGYAKVFQGRFNFLITGLFVFQELPKSLPAFFNIASRVGGSGIVIASAAGRSSLATSSGPVTPLSDLHLAHKCLHLFDPRLDEAPLFLAGIEAGSEPFGRLAAPLFHSFAYLFRAALSGTTSS